MGHSNPRLAGGLKMKAFHESPYGDDVVSGLMNRQVEQKYTPLRVRSKHRQARRHTSSNLFRAPVATGSER